MIDFSQLLLDKTDAILEKWVEAVRQDNHIESDDNLSNSAIENHLSHVLAAMATVLSESKTSEIQPIVKASLHHGVLRAEQGFEPAEIAREYSLLRQVIFSILEPELVQGSPTELIRAVRLIDAVVDEAASQCFNSYVDEKLEGLEQLHSQLKLTNQELTRLVRANQDNFSHLAHELKTPLTSIIGYSDLFLRKQRQNAAIKDSFANVEHIERVLRNGRQLLRLINDSLEVSRYEAGKMKLQVVPTDVRSLIKSVIEVLEPLARAKGLKMVVECDRAPEQVLTDSLRLQQIVTNLASNAIRYTDSGSVRVTCRVVADDQWAIAVSDTGIGIAPEDQTIIFDPFVQAGSTNKPHLPDSTGLGLAIVSRLVKLLQGKIELVSQVGVGSTFTVILPSLLTVEEVVSSR